jgi:hypothetical protein
MNHTVSKESGIQTKNKGVFFMVNSTEILNND